MRHEICEVMRKKCDTSEFGVRDAITFFGCIPGVNTDVKDIKNKFHEQPPNVLAVLERCRKAEEAISTDRDFRKLGPRKGQGIENPLTHKEVLVKESMEKTAEVVQSDKAGVCHTLAQFAFVNLMKECKLDGRSYDEVAPSLIPSIRIVAHNPPSDLSSKKLRAAGTHNFVIVGFDEEKELTYYNLERMKDEILIVDPWYFALGNNGEEWGYGVYTWDEYPKGFLHNLSCTYDNQKPFTQEDLSAAREIAENQKQEIYNLQKNDLQMMRHVQIIKNSLNKMKVKLSDLKNELSNLNEHIDDDWDLEDEQVSDKELNDKKESIGQEIASLKERIDLTQATLDQMPQDVSEFSSKLQVS
jgi:hypothetical protein